VERLKHWLNIAAYAIGVLLLLAVVGTCYQAWLERHEAGRFPPPGSLIDIGGRRLHVVCQGSGSPGVLLEASGLGTVLQYADVQRKLSSSHRTCAYDRAGLGWSDPSRQPASARNLEADLEQLLGRIDLPSPYILVASSAGGLDIELFVRKRPERVAGIVWLDALAGHMVDHLPELRNLEHSACLARAAAWLGAIRLADPLGLAASADDSARRSAALTYRRQTLDAVCSLTKSFQASADALRAAPPINSAIPAIVIVHGEPRDISPDATPSELASLEPRWRAAQAAFAAQFRHSRLETADHTGHLIASERPDLVARAVERVAGTSSWE